MSLLINLIPIIIILAVLFMRKHMLFAGLLGGIAAVFIGGFSISDSAAAVTEGIQTMFSYIAPILYAAAALFAGFLVLIQAAATYMAGMGAGNTMVIAPLVAAAVGAVPEVIAGMAIATAVCFTTSPASTETVLAAESVARDVFDHAAAMRPITLLFVVLGAALAVYGVYKRGSLLLENEEAKAKKDEKESKMWVRAIPAIALLVMVVGSSKLNKLIGYAVFTPATNVLFTAVLTALLTPLDINGTCDALVEGSRYILTTLFGVGIFLAFINLVAKLGTFEQLAALVGNVPSAVIVPCAMIMAFLIAIPSGAFCAGVLTLILPTLALLGMPSEAMGLVAISAGFGTQVSPVQINIAALSDGFKVDIMKIVKQNMIYLTGALLILILCSFVLTGALLILILCSFVIV